MANDERDVMLFGDAEGNYYLLPRDVVEAGRVPEEQKPQVQELIGDVSGHIIIVGGFQFLGGLTTTALSQRGIIVVGGRSAWLSRQ